MNKENLIEELDFIAKNSLYGFGINHNSIVYSFTIFKKYIGKKVLELGPAEGIMTDLIYNTFSSDLELTVVEGSSLFCENLKKKYSQAHVYNSLFEDFYTEEKYDTIILGHVLEHVDDPQKVLAHVKHFLKNDGKILAAVPNANSLHRQAAVEMGLIESLNSMSELDKHHGHKRVYSRDEFKEDVVSAGLKIEKLGGYWLKPLSNAQLEASWTEEMISSYMKLGEKYPDIAAEIYVVATL